MTTRAIESIRTGGGILARQPKRIRELEQEVSQLKKEVTYWLQMAEQRRMESMQNDHTCKILKRRIKKLNNSKPGPKTVGQAQAEHDLQQRGF